jgi:GT2 family glycosyltransferase
MSTTLKLSVVVCTYNRDDYILKALSSLAGQHLPKHLFEVLLINNNSTDSTAALCRPFGEQHPQLNYRYMMEPNQGLSHARNRGIREAQGEIILFLDDDATAEPDYLQEMLSFFQHTPNAAACGGRIYPVFESKRPRWMSHFLVSLTSSLNLGDAVKVFSHRQFPVGANMAVRKSMFDRYGLFNPDLGRKGNSMDGAEEKDLFYRMMAGGEKIYYVPTAIVHHYVPDRRLTFEFFRRQAIGIGKSERIRALSLSKGEYAKSLLREGLKWGVSGLLCGGYLLALKPVKAWRLLVFRRYVSQGLLIKSPR